MKKCTKCNEAKPRAEFSKNKLVKAAAYLTDRS